MENNNKGNKMNKIEKLRTAAEQGDVKAQRELGLQYDEGFDVEQDYKEAMKWYRMAAEDNDADAQYYLGSMYEEGHGVEVNYAEAARWYRKAAEQGDASAQESLGELYLRGEGVEQSDTEAFLLFQKAVEQDDPIACYHLGRMYYKGWGVKQDYAEALRLFLKSVEERDGAVADVNGCTCTIGNMYFDGLGTEQNYEEAMRWYQKTAARNADAQFGIGTIYYEGLGVEENYTEAMKWFRMAAEQGHATAQFNVGYMYDEGLGVEMDYEEAARWYRMAAEQGDSDAQFNLATMYANGDGVELNMDEAIRWLQKSADQGDEEAKEQLKRFQNNTRNNTMEDIAHYKKKLEAKMELMKNCHLRYGCSLRFEYDDEVNSPNQGEFLESLTEAQIKDEPLPLRLLLWNSVYYPASGLDGGVIKYCNTLGRDMGIRSFVYCDYNTNEAELCDNVADHFRGYTIFAHRSVSVGELGVKRLSMEPIDDRAKNKHLTPEGEPFCHWFIMERDSDFGDEHGPKRFSLLFLCCEGVTAYVQLYSQNEILPKALAIIQPGTGFGGNWTDFRDYDAPLSFVLRHIPYMPRYIFNGGMGNSEDDYTHLPWDEYAIEDKVANYYGPGDGRMVVFKRGRR